MNDFLDHEGTRPHHPTTASPKAAAPSTPEPTPAIITTLREHWSGLFPIISFEQLVAEIAPYVQHECWAQIWALALELLGYVTGIQQEHEHAWQITAHARREGWVSGGPTF